MHLFQPLAAALTALALAPSNALAQGCVTTLSADVAQVSVSAGGIQNIDVQVSGVPWFVSTESFSMIGSFAGTSPGSPFLAHGGLFLNADRYMLNCLNGRSRLIRPVNPGAYAPHYLTLDAQGHSAVQIVVAPNVYSAYLGRTVHHGAYAIDHQLLPACGSNTIALTFVP